MKSVEAAGSVIWRLPGSEIIYFIENSSGNDQFLISSFDKSITPKVIKGQIREILPGEIPGILSQWIPDQANDTVSTSKTDYLRWVEKAKTSIAGGRFSKVVLARKEWHNSTVEASKLFKLLMEHHPMAFVYAFYMEGTFMVGASPETLLDRRGDHLYTEALGGTQTKDGYKEKELLEHDHISRYIQYILTGEGYAYEPGDTSSRDAGIVKHLLTPVSARSQGFAKDMELAFRLHPTPAVCGLPYNESLDFIRETEDFERKFYSGFLGPVAQNGDFNFFVNLRCAELYREGMVLYAGAGLNQMSDAEDEWSETANKMQTIAQWL